MNRKTLVFILLLVMLVFSRNLIAQEQKPIQFYTISKTDLNALEAEIVSLETAILKERLATQTAAQRQNEALQASQEALEIEAGKKVLYRAGFFGSIALNIVLAVIIILK